MNHKHSTGQAPITYLANVLSSYRYDISIFLRSADSHEPLLKEFKSLFILFNMITIQLCTTGPFDSHLSYLPKRLNCFTVLYYQLFKSQLYLAFLTFLVSFETLLNLPYLFHLCYPSLCFVGILPQFERNILSYEI